MNGREANFVFSGGCKGSRCDNNQLDDPEDDHFVFGKRLAEQVYF